MRFIQSKSGCSTARQPQLCCAPHAKSFRQTNVVCSSLRPTGQNSNHDRRAILSMLLLNQFAVRQKAFGSAQRKYSIEQLKDVIYDDLQNKQYYVTGDITFDAFADDCYFKDPTIQLTGSKKYSDAVKTLFYPSQSRADLITIEVTSPNTIYATWRLEGVLTSTNLPIKPYTGTTTYYINDEGRIQRHIETWDIPVLDVFISCFFPQFGVPPAPPIEQLRANSAAPVA